MISSTCFGQTFAHLQERKTEVPSYRTRSATLPRSEPLPTTTTGHYTTCCKNLSLALLKMGKGLPETCWADHWRSMKLLLLHLVGFYFTLPTSARFREQRFACQLPDPLSLPHCVSVNYSMASFRACYWFHHTILLTDKNAFCTWNILRSVRMVQKVLHISAESLVMPS